MDQARWALMDPLMNVALDPTGYCLARAPKAPRTRWVSRSYDYATALPRPAHRSPQVLDTVGESTLGGLLSGAAAPLTSYKVLLSTPPTSQDPSAAPPGGLRDIVEVVWEWECALLPACAWGQERHDDSESGGQVRALGQHASSHVQNI